MMKRAGHRAARRAAVLLSLALWPTTGPTQSGPPRAPSERDTPAERAIALYKAEHGPRVPVVPCRPASSDTITVCGTPGALSPDRIPLPDERGPRASPRTATGELPSTAGGVGGSPAMQNPGTGVTLTMGLGGPNAGAVTATGHGEE